MNPITERPVDDGDESKDVLVAAPKRIGTVAPRYKSLTEHMIEKVKALNGYPFIAVSRIIKIDKDLEMDTLGWSTTTRKLASGFIHTGRGDIDEFINAFEGSGIGLIVAFPRMPTMAKDGMYTAYDVHGNPMPFINVDEVPLANAAEFQPFVIIRDRNDKGEFTFRELRGNPYPQFTPDTARELAKAIMGVGDNGQPVQQDAK